MRSFRLLFPVLAFVLIATATALSQINPNEDQGLKPYDSLHGGDLDSVSVTGGGLSLHIPLASFPQRGNLDLSFMISFSNKQWYVKPAKFDSQGQVSSPAQWLPMPTSGVQIVSSADWLLNTCTTAEPQDPNIQGQTLYDWSDSVSSPDGSSHMFGDQIAANGEIFPVRSLDASGLLRPDAQTLILPNGTRYVYSTTSGCAFPSGRVRGGAQPVSVTDTNGNQITISTSGWTDTMGRLIPGSSSTAFVGTQVGVSTTDLSKCPTGSVSARIWNIPGVSNVNSGIRTFYFCYSNFTLSTNFPNPSNITGLNYGPTAIPLLSAVVEPDLTMWTFTYDNYGDVTRVNFPTGGSLAYSYIIGPPNANSGTSFSTWTSSRTVDAHDGTGAHTWNYNYQGNFPTGSGTAIYLFSVKGITTVTSPDGNDVVHNIGPWTSSGGCPGYVYQTQYFQGPASSNVVLKTVQNQYDCIMATPGGNLDGVALNSVPTQEATIWPAPPGAQSHSGKVVKTYDPNVNDPNGQPARIGSVLQADEYDFSGAVARSTLTRYLWQDNASYKTANLVSLPVWSTVYNGPASSSTTLPACSSSGSPACVSQSKYAYDEGTRATSGIGTPTHVAPPNGDTVRGLQTSSSRWLDTATAFVSAGSTYLDTGMKATSTDALNHLTSYTYSSTFLGTYVTQTNLPDTQMPDSGAPIVHHVISGNYDFNTGLLTSFTDENGQPFSYTYDIMLRLTQGNHPDGGQTKFFYPDPNTAERQRLISGTTYDDFKVKFDGVGRPNQNLQLTPDCAGWIKTDTTYDVAGHVKTVSNQYCLTSEATYGVTQRQYDALGRNTQATKQDQSTSSTVFNDIPGDTSGPAAICTTVVDEAGKKRQSCMDAFGRLIKALEPNPGAVATTASGWVSINGAEQSATSQPATPGSAAITITGTEQTSQTCLRSCFTIWDTGTVTITVNGFAKTYTYGKFDTPATVAWNLSCLFHNDASSPVDAPCPASAGTSTTVNVTARSTGAATNYAFTTSSATSDTSCNNFCSASFFASPASGSLTGGQNASSVADSGTVTVTVNGTGYATSFGSSDTSSTIAGRLASLINAGSFASAAASGSTINLASKTPGTVGDYTLTTSYTWNTAQFTNPSFTTSTSGSTLAGAKDTSALNNNPFVTTYQYNTRGDLICVHQKATDTTTDVACTGTTPPAVPSAWRQRFFTYDSLSRILTAMNPETNSTGSTKISYSYDNNGNLISKTEPAPNQPWGATATVTVNYTYDALNRLLDTTYTGMATQTSSHRYDYSTFQGVAISNPVGREVAATTSAGASYIMSYDPMGRILKTTQCNPGVTGCKNFTAAYDKLGDLTSLVYPANNFTVTYGYDSAARLVSATDSAGVIYAQSPVFWATGLMREFSSPNFNNNKFHTELNNRLQPVEMWAGASQGAGALFDKTYTYNPAGGSQLNNGNVYTITNLKDDTRTQSFSYDPLNRLLTAGDKAHWSNSYVYDAWGNLLQKNPGAPAGENLVKVADINNHLSGISYDAGGNETADGLGNTFVYDAENRITSAAGVTYTYDTYGRRIQKSTGANYWYGAAGIALAETDSAGNWTNYIFFGDRRLARNVTGDIKYYITDHLRSTAMFVDKAGTSAAILDDNDFYPWGGLVPGVGKNTSNNTIKFTGQYRDAESQLDYFGARYYANINGRFMSPDWASKPVTVPYAKFGDPQTLNLYSYVENRPTVVVDPDGHEEEVASDTVNTSSCGAGCTQTDTKHDDGSSETNVTQVGQTQTQTVSLGNGNWMTVTTTYTTSETTERDSNGQVSKITTKVTADFSITGPDGHGGTTTLASGHNVPVSERTKTKEDLKAAPQTAAAKLKNRPVSEDTDLLPVVGPYVKRVADFFGISYGDVLNAIEPPKDVATCPTALYMCGPF